MWLRINSVFNSHNVLQCVLARNQQVTLIDKPFLKIFNFFKEKFWISHSFLIRQSFFFPMPYYIFWHFSYFFILSFIGEILFEMSTVRAIEDPSPCHDSNSSVWTSWTRGNRLGWAPRRMQWSQVCSDDDRLLYQGNIT